MKKLILPLLLFAGLFTLVGCGNDPNTCYTGDRVLVAKFLYDTHLSDLDPFDVVVFKFPEEPVGKDRTPKNYIKRLIGLPRQTIGVYYGDLYVAAEEDLLAAMRKAGLTYDPSSEDHLPLRRRTYRDRGRELLERGHPCFKLLQKPPDKILAVQRIVY